MVAQTKYVITGRHSRDAFSDLVDNAGGVVTRITGALERLALRVPARHELPVSPIDAGRAYHDANLPRSCMRLGRLAHAEDLRTAVLGELESKHDDLPLLWLCSPTDRCTATSDRPSRYPSSRAQPRRPRAGPRLGRPSSSAFCLPSAAQAASASA